MAAWADQYGAAHDVYGEGALIQTLEKDIAELLDMPAACFVITGTLAQSILLDRVARHAENPRVAMHATAHLLLHELDNHQLYAHQPVTVGADDAVWDWSDLQSLTPRPAAILYEVPMREIGGQLPSWHAFCELKAQCRAHGIHMHIDGARLWEAACGWGRSPAALCAGADSVYVSLYKGLGGWGGALLLSDVETIARMRRAMIRRGGNVYHRTPYVLAAAMQWRERLAKLPDCLDATRRLYALIKDFPALRVNPAEVHVNMLHFHLPMDVETALCMRDAVKQKHGLILFNRATALANPQRCRVEWTVGDVICGMQEDELRSVLQVFQQAVQANAQSSQ